MCAGCFRCKPVAETWLSLKELFCLSHFLGCLTQPCLPKRIKDLPGRHGNLVPEKRLLRFVCLFVCFAVLGFEFKAYTLSHFTSPSGFELRSS
jgi:hypothetical protein